MNIYLKYYDGGRRVNLETARLHESLRTHIRLVLDRLFPNAQEIVVIHAGTVASKKHFERNPLSLHSGIPPLPPPGNPPAAIDLMEIRFLDHQGIEHGVDFTENMRNRILASNEWRFGIFHNYEPVTAHSTQREREHLHCGCGVK